MGNSVLYSLVKPANTGSWKEGAQMYRNSIRTFVVALIVVLLAGCAGMSPREQRMLSGGAIGATGGAIIGAAAGSAGTGAAIGGAAGVLGGLVVDEMDRRNYR